MDEIRLIIKFQILENLFLKGFFEFKKMTSFDDNSQLYSRVLEIFLGYFIDYKSEFYDLKYESDQVEEKMKYKSNIPEHQDENDLAEFGIEDGIYDIPIDPKKKIRMKNLLNPSKKRIKKNKGIKLSNDNTKPKKFV